MDVRRLQPVRYLGNPETSEVWVDCAGEPLQKLQLGNHVVQHSQEFSWGVRNEGAAQLALAMLLDVLEQVDTIDGRHYALQYHQDFKLDVILKLEADKSFEVSEGEIREWLRSQGFRFKKSPRDVEGASVHSSAPSLTNSSGDQASSSPEGQPD